MDEDNDLGAAFICTVIFATTFLNLYAELSECCRLRNSGGSKQKNCAHFEESMKLGMDKP